MPVLQSISLVKIGDGLLITPYHPIFHDGVWCFPSTIADSTEHTVQSVFNVLLDEGAFDMLVGDHYVITLAHGLNSPITQHAFLGTPLVRQMLQVRFIVVISVLIVILSLHLL